jgi:small subunit ribosomal protein S10e
MLIPKADRKKIHEASFTNPTPHTQKLTIMQYLFREGVLVAKKDFNLPKHGDIDTKNLFVRFPPPQANNL